MKGSPSKFFPQASFVVVNLDNPVGADALRQSGSKNFVFKGSEFKTEIDFKLYLERWTFSSETSQASPYCLYTFEFYYLSIRSFAIIGSLR